MKTTLELPAERVAPPIHRPTQGNSSPAWEYCFLLQEEWNPNGGELTQLAAAGWFVVSFRTRLDNQREYLLKRPRR
jgi:hypothetical protein